MYKKINVVLDKKVRAFCVKPYAGHPKGCPQFGKKKGCPPDVDFFENIYDLSQPVYAIWNVFDLGSHVKKMKEKHPEWSERQLKCCLYWQPGARKKLKEHIVVFLKDMKLDGYSVTTCPEAMGVNITDTMKSIGIDLEWPPENFTYQIALAGKKK